MKENILLGLMVVGTFLLRTVGQWDKVFVDGNIWFRGADPWYHMRLVDNMMRNFPIPLSWDVYSPYPNGAAVGYYPLLTWIVSGFGQVFNYELVGAFLPPILGALILIPIYFLGKELFSRGVGLLACVLVAILPGELFHRSLLGFTDHHILESILMVTTILFIVLAYRRQRLLYSALGGLSLGLYLLNWPGGIFLVFIIALWFILQFYYDYLKGLPTNFLCKSLTITLGISLLLSFWLLPTYNLILLLLASTTPLFLYSLSRLGKKVLLYTSIGISTTGIILLSLNVYGMSGQILLSLRYMFWGFGGTTIQEALPLTPTVAFAQYGIPIILFFGGLYFCIRNKVNILFVVWTIILLLTTLSQMRWGYYFTINVALLSAHLVFEVAKYLKKDVRTGAIIVMVFFLILPSIKGTVGLAVVPNTITPDWYNAMVWMRENTSEQFPDGAYYELNPGKADYGVLSWWDYGHWIIRIARRAPMTNPLFHDYPAQSQFLASRSEEEANEILEGHNIKYIIIDNELLTKKWHAVIKKAGVDTRMLDSVAYKLWSDELEGWKLIHREGEVKIYERKM